MAKSKTTTTKTTTTSKPNSTTSSKVSKATKSDPKYKKLKDKELSSNGTSGIAVASHKANYIPDQPFVPEVYVRITSPGSTEKDKSYLELTLPPSTSAKHPSSGNIGLDMTVQRQAKNNQPAGVSLEMTFADETAILVEEALESAIHGGVSDLGGDFDYDNAGNKIDPKTGKSYKEEREAAKNKKDAAATKKRQEEQAKKGSPLPTSPFEHDNNKKNKPTHTGPYSNKIPAATPFKPHAHSIASLSSKMRKSIALSSPTSMKNTVPYSNDINSAISIIKSVSPKDDKNTSKKLSKSSKKDKDHKNQEKAKNKGKKSNKSSKDKDSSGDKNAATTAGLDFYYGYYGEVRSQMYHCTVKDATVQFTSYGVRLTVTAVSTATAEGTSPKYRSFKSGNPSQIVLQIAKQNDWDVGTVVATKPLYDGPSKVVKGKPVLYTSKSSKATKLKVFTQKGVGDNEFISKTLIPDSVSNLDNSSDYVFWMSQGKNAPAVNFAPKAYKAAYDAANKNGEPSQTYTFRWGAVSDTSVRSFTPDYSIAKSSFKPDSVSASTLEKFSNAMFNTQYDKSNDSWVSAYANSSDAYSVNYPLNLGGSTYTFQEIQGAAARMWYLNQNNSYKASMNIVGDPTLEPQSAIAVIIMNPNGLPHHTSGIYLILSITDTINGGLFNSSLELMKLPTTPDIGGTDGIKGISVHKGDPQEFGSDSSKSTTSKKSTDDPSDDGSAKGKWIKPISGPWGANCDGFGPNHPAPHRQNNFHDGYDFGSYNHGSKIRAPHAGTVVVARVNMSTWSKDYIVIKSGSIYTILQEFSTQASGIKVKKGDKVKTGQHVATLDSTGYHLHLGINTKTYRESETCPWSYGHWRNPRKFIQSHR